MRNPAIVILFKLSFLLLVIFGSCRQKLQNQQSRSSHQPLTQVKPEEAGMSAERLAMIDTLMQQYIRNKWIPGGVGIIT